MAREHRVRVRRQRPPSTSLGAQRLAADPVEQLTQWRTWQHDTLEFAAVGDADGEYLGPAPAGGPSAADSSPPDQAAPAVAERRDRPGRLLIGGGLVAAALILSGLAAVGVGPVRSLLGPDQPGQQTRRASSDSSTARTAGSKGAGITAGTAGSPTAPAGADSGTLDGAGKTSREALRGPATRGKALLPAGDKAAPPDRPGPAQPRAGRPGRPGRGSGPSSVGNGDGGRPGPR